jgi:transposase
MTNKKKLIFDDEVAKASFGIIFGLLILIAISFFSLKPTILAIVDNKSKIEELTPLETKLKTKKNNLSKAKQNFSKIYDQVADLDYALENKVDLVENIKILEKISSELNSSDYAIAIEKITINNLVEDKEIENLLEANLKELKLNMALTGDYSSQKMFIQMLSENLRNLKLNSVVFSIPKINRENNNLINAELDITINYFN